MLGEIVEVAERYTELKRSGRRLVGLCPLHAEKTASFTIDPDKGLFYCFSCATGGDAVTLLQKVEGIDFKEAKRRLGLADTPPPTSRDNTAREAAKLTRRWQKVTSMQIASGLREIQDRARVTKMAIESLPFHDSDLDDELHVLRREWALLADLDDDIAADPGAMYEQRGIIENVLLEVGR